MLSKEVVEALNNMSNSTLTKGDKRSILSGKLRRSINALYDLTDIEEPTHIRRPIPTKASSMVLISNAEYRELRGEGGNAIHESMHNILPAIYEHFDHYVDKYWTIISISIMPVLNVFYYVSMSYQLLQWACYSTVQGSDTLLNWFLHDRGENITSTASQVSSVTKAHKFAKNHHVRHSPIGRKSGSILKQKSVSSIKTGSKSSMTRRKSSFAGYATDQSVVSNEETARRRTTIMHNIMNDLGGDSNSPSSDSNSD